MTGKAHLFLLAAVLAALVLGLAALFRLRLGQGDVFPEYSSLRADPLGTRALHDSLGQVPGFRVERRTRSLTSLAPLPPRLIVLAGLDADDWTQVTTEEFNALDAAVRAGSRLVLAFRAQVYSEKEEERKNEAEARRKRREPAEANPRKPKVTFADLKEKWGVELQARALIDRDPDTAQRTAVADTSLPERVAWRSDLFFRPEAGGEWRTLYRRGAERVLLERPLGLGSIVLAGDSFFISNEALQRERPTALLAWLVGPHTRVMFDESHLGVVADRGVATLLRRYGLAGAGFTLLLLAGLFVWQRMALFIPPAGDYGEVALAYHPAAGLEALLRRAVPADELVAVCATEWKRTARAGDIARVDAALTAGPKNTPAAARYNAIAQALKRR